jgi:hypothetical protein
MKQITQPKPNSLGLIAALLATATWGMVGIFVRWLPGWSPFAVLAGRDSGDVADPVTNAKYPTRFYAFPSHSADLVAEFASNWLFLAGYYSISNGTRR